MFARRSERGHIAFLELRSGIAARLRTPPRVPVEAVASLESFLGVRFLGTEYVTGKAHGGRSALNENVINQCLFYLDWLMDLQGDFTLQVLRNIELLRYRRYGGDLLLLELVRASATVRAQRRYRSSEAAQLEHYIAFRRLKNFARVKLRSRDVQVWTRLDPTSVLLEEGFTRDVRQIGHTGTGELEIRIQTKTDLERAHPLLVRSYQGA